MIDTFDWCAKWAQYTPNKVALKDYSTGRELTYSVLNRQADRLAYNLIHNWELHHGSRIVVLAENCLEYLILFSAAQKTGVILVPLNYRLSREEIDFLLENASPEAIIWEEKFRDQVKTSQYFQKCKHTLSLRNFKAFINQVSTEEVEDRKMPSNITEDHAILILYTSGSTGFPKGVLYTHKMLFWNSVNTALRLNLTSDDRTINCMPLFHTGGWNVLITPLLHRGGYTCLFKQFDPRLVMEALDEEDISIFMGVPTMLGMMSQTSEFRTTSLNSLRYFIVGGEPMPIPLIELWAEKGISVRQGFGMTEAGPNLTSLHQDDALRKKGSIGVPNFYVEIKIVKDGGEEAKATEKGELWIKGPIVTPGYWQNKKETDKSITDGWLHTGDLVTKDEEGFLYVVDRIKNMFISGGENIYPAEIERVLIQHPAIEEVAVIGIPDKKWGEVGKAFVILTPNANLSQTEIQIYCEQKLARFKVPKSICLLPSLPKNATGKIDKKALRQLL